MIETPEIVPAKTAKELKKEQEKAEKERKFREKQEKLAREAAEKKEKAEKEPKAVVVETPIATVSYTSNTAKGDKKDTQCALPDAYSPVYVEAAWYAWWEKMGFFKPECAAKYFPNVKEPREKFVIAMPPPNVTGSLHLGHALMCAIEDALTRWHRMQGHETLWCPGFDHAGIATQVVVEKKLKREQNKTRHDLGRDAFVQEIWKWKNEKGDRIAQQLRRIGSSCDWDRARFTMDDVSVKAVLEAFIRMHEKGLIYRAKRLVNWSCSLNSAISDIEVDKVPLKGRTMLSIPGYTEKIEFGTLTSFAYRLCDSNEEIVVATTRPETMLGDTAIAVHPNDARYTAWIGKYVQHPFVDRKLPIVADEMVDPSFGTGAVKITPAHDANDFECGKRHSLPMITVFDDKGIVNSEGGSFAGMKRFEARKAIVKALKEKGFFKDVQDTETVLPICSRSKDVIEPMLKSQWYVNCKDMAARACEAVRNKTLKIVPDFHEAVWFRWLEDCHDWCISRQLWWGHRIPAYHIRVKGMSTTPDDTDNKYWVSAQNAEEALNKAHARFPDVAKSDIELWHDEDVLDTWFSSGIFPFSICGWPQQTPDLSKFYPGTLLETGHDILFFWVARMVMMGFELTDKLPFDTVLLHAIIRDAHGRKMSKSLGNIIDPLDVIDGITLENLHKQLELYNLDPKEIEKAVKGQKDDYPQGIPECGTDALRFALCAYTAQGRDINLDVLRVQGYRHFCNKLWNATRFAMNYGGLGVSFEPVDDIKTVVDLRLMDKWILSRLADTVRLCDQGMRQYELTTATTALFNFWLYDLCDYYIEYLKPSFANKDSAHFKTSQQVLYTCLDVALRLIHPFMPFVSEELFQRLPRRPAHKDLPSICISSYPMPNDFDSFFDVQLESEVKFAQEAIGKIRSLRADYQLTPKIKTELFFQQQSCDVSLSHFSDLIETMTHASKIEFLNEQQQQPSGCAMATLGDKCKVFVLLRGVIDVDKETTKLNKKRDTLQKQMDTLQKEMKNDKVPDAVKEKNKEKFEQMEKEKKLIEEGIVQLQNMKL